MAEISKEIQIKITAPGRPCWVFTKDPERPFREAVLHLFTTKSYPVEPFRGEHGAMVSFPIAVVEYEDGYVDYVDVSAVKLLDSFETMEEHRAAWSKESLGKIVREWKL